jgi:plasmid stabilization system protein ParE
MAARVILSPEAREQIRQLQRYIADASFPERSAKYIARLRAALRGLGEAPFQGTPREDLGKGLRTVGFERRITIVFMSTRTSVMVVGIFYAGREPESFV